MEDFFKTVKKQSICKYDNRNRIDEEKKTSRLSIRLKKKSMDKLKKIAQEANITQTDAIEMLINHGKVYQMPPEAKKLSHTINDLNQRLNETIERFGDGYQEESIKRVYEIGREYSEAKKSCLASLIGR